MILNANGVIAEGTRHISRTEQELRASRDRPDLLPREDSQSQCLLRHTFGCDHSDYNILEPVKRAA